MPEKGPNNIIYNQNMKALAERYPDLADKIKKLGKNESYKIVLSERKELPNLLLFLFFPARGWLHAFRGEGLHNCCPYLLHQEKEDHLLAW